MVDTMWGYTWPFSALNAADSVSCCCSIYCIFIAAICVGFNSPEIKSDRLVWEQAGDLEKWFVPSQVKQSFPLAGQRPGGWAVEQFWQSPFAGGLEQHWLYLPCFLIFITWSIWIISSLLSESALRKSWLLTQLTLWSCLRVLDPSLSISLAWTPDQSVDWGVFS